MSRPRAAEKLARDLAVGEQRDELALAAAVRAAQGIDLDPLQQVSQLRAGGVRERRAGDVSAQPLEPVTIVSFAIDLGVEREAVDVAQLAGQEQRWSSAAPAEPLDALAALLTDGDPTLQRGGVSSSPAASCSSRGTEYFQLTRPHASGPVTFDLAVPANVALLDLPVYVQGACSGGRVRLSNAIDALIGEP